MSFVINDYITNIQSDWIELSSMPKINQAQIENLSDDNIKMYLYCFYDFPELKTYSKELLKRKIGTNNTLYLMASFCGNIRLMEYLEKMGLDINAKNDEGENAFILACGHLETIKYLQEKEFDINIKNIDGANAYMSASLCGNLQVMKYLEEIGININIKDNDGYNAYLATGVPAPTIILKTIMSE